MLQQWSDVNYLNLTTMKIRLYALFTHKKTTECVFSKIK